MIDELDTVVLSQDLPEHGLKRVMSGQSYIATPMNQGSK
jgi:hypothetical protein